MRVRHTLAFPERPVADRDLDEGGEYQWRRDGEFHLFNPDTVYKLQHATRSGQYKIYKEYTQAVNDQTRKRATLRGLFELKLAATPIPLEEVEPAESILKRFATGAMSYGSISQEAHETLAIAMNRLGGKSNTGEGGEDPARYVPDANGDSRGAAPSSRSRPRGSASRANISSTPTICRSRWRRVRSPARAASCPGTRCTRGSQRCATRRPVSA